MTDDLLRFRAEFPILERTPCMISNSPGAMPRGVEGSLQHYAETWNTHGVRAWEGEWSRLAAQAGDETGTLMNAPKGPGACLGTTVPRRGAFLAAFLQRG